MEYDLNRILAFAREQGVSVMINFWESDGSLEVEVLSCAPVECFYQKRVATVEHFIESWHEHVESNRNMALAKKPAPKLSEE